MNVVSVYKAKTFISTAILLHKTGQTESIHADDNAQNKILSVTLYCFWALFRSYRIIDTNPMLTVPILEGYHPSQCTSWPHSTRNETALIKALSTLASLFRLRPASPVARQAALGIMLPTQAVTHCPVGPRRSAAVRAGRKRTDKTRGPECMI